MLANPYLQTHQHKTNQRKPTCHSEARFLREEPAPLVSSATMRYGRHAEGIDVIKSLLRHRPSQTGGTHP